MIHICLELELNKENEDKHDFFLKQMQKYFMISKTNPITWNLW